MSVTEHPAALSLCHQLASSTPHTEPCLLGSGAEVVALDGNLNVGIPQDAKVVAFCCFTLLDGDVALTETRQSNIFLSRFRKTSEFYRVFVRKKYVPLR